jgi:hypothetical protein
VKGAELHIQYNRKEMNNMHDLKDLVAVSVWLLPIIAVIVYRAYYSPKARALRREDRLEGQRIDLALEQANKRQQDLLAQLLERDGLCVIVTNAQGGRDATESILINGLIGRGARVVQANKTIQAEIKRNEIPSSAKLPGARWIIFCFTKEGDRNGGYEHDYVTADLRIFEAGSPCIAYASAITVGEKVLDSKILECIATGLSFIAIRKDNAKKSRQADAEKSEISDAAEVTAQA